MLVTGVVLPMLAVSSDECVRALMLAGFRVSKRTAQGTVLERSYHRVEVPAGLMLTHAVLEALLHDAGVSGTEFIDLVSRTFPNEASSGHDTGVRARPNAKRKPTSDSEPAMVLIVDDDYDARAICAATLEHAGYEVVCARTVKEGADAAARRRPSAVVLDSRLPDGNGLDLLKTWRASPPMREVPVVVVTAFSELEYVAAATADGAAFMVKPCRSDALRIVIPRMLQASAQPSSQVRERRPRARKGA